MPSQIKKDDIVYAGYPTAQVYERSGEKQITQLLWGDWVKAVEDEMDGWVTVRARNHDGRMKVTDIQRERLLEVVFVDIGQGDGAFAVMPDGRLMIVDAGEGDNLYRFLRWRFAGFRKSIEFDTAVITHPDQDHYKGFQRIFNEPNLTIRQLFHNGIMEDTSTDGLCASKVIDGARYIDELMTDAAALETFLGDTNRWNRARPMQFPGLMKQALDSGRVGRIEMMATTPPDETYLPGYGPESDVKIRVLGPLLETNSDGQQRLRWFKSGSSYDKGKTKNGHSVLLKLEYGGLKLMLGGDLNSASEEFLMKSYSGLNSLPETTAEWEDLRTRLGGLFSADVAKCCHHGSHDFVDGFLGCVHPAATVISSGDEESHAHPRCDTLGAIGRNSRGMRPLIFSTELARSTAPNARPQQQKELKDLRAAIKAAANEEARAAAEKAYEEALNRVLGRYVSVYGAINLRSDGKKVVMAYRLEADRNNRGKVERWDVYRLEPDDSGTLTFTRPES